MPFTPSLLKVSPLTREFIVGCVILVAVIASRSFSIGYLAELSADESELLVQIDRYEHDLMPWRSVDGSTIGPVNPWFLLAMKQKGWPVTYSGIHLLSALLQALIAVVSYYTIRLFLPFGSACLVAFAGTLAVGCSASINFMYFATELVPALGLGLAVLGIVWSRQRPPASSALLAAAAFCSGISPWAKLQAAPISLLLCGYAGWTAWTHGATNRSLRHKMAAFSLVVLGGVLPTIVILTAVISGGVFPDFWASYVVANLGYADHFTLTDAAVRLGQLISASQLNGLMTGIAALGVFHLALTRIHRPAEETSARWLATFTWLYLGTAVYSCIRPPHGFGHYHIFLIGPLFVALGALLQRTRLGWRSASQERSHRKLGIVAALCVLVPTGLLSVRHYFHDGEPLREHLTAKQRDAERSFATTVTRAIQRAAPAASNMVVWGWMPTLHVKTHLRSATRHTISHFLIDSGPSRELLRHQFLQEVRSSRPDVIVDAVASDCFTWYWPIESSGIESFPEFWKYVQANYTLVFSIIGEEAGVPLRIFVRKPPAPPRDRSP